MLAGHYLVTTSGWWRHITEGRWHSSEQHMAACGSKWQHVARGGPRSLEALPPLRRGGGEAAHVMREHHSSSGVPQCR